MKAAFVYLAVPSFSNEIVRMPFISSVRHFGETASTQRLCFETLIKSGHYRQGGDSAVSTFSLRLYKNLQNVDLQQTVEPR